MPRLYLLAVAAAALTATPIRADLITMAVEFKGYSVTNTSTNQTKTTDLRFVIESDSQRLFRGYLPTTTKDVGYFPSSSTVTATEFGLSNATTDLLFIDFHLREVGLTDGLAIFFEDFDENGEKKVFGIGVSGIAGLDDWNSTSGFEETTTTAPVVGNPLRFTVGGQVYRLELPVVSQGTDPPVTSVSFSAKVTPTAAIPEPGVVGMAVLGVGAALGLVRRVRRAA